MCDITLNGISVKFPFKPYKVQEEYMKKVIECLQNGHHGVLESPTGTGKTLSLLCSSLSWLIVKKAQMQASALQNSSINCSSIMKGIKGQLDIGGGTFKSKATWEKPKIIYASRTHSQLSQAMQELKRTSYNHVKATILGSRDQMCIHPEVSKEQNSSTKIHMCQEKIKNGNCWYYTAVEERIGDPVFNEQILDIEDLIKKGKKEKCCPYFLTRALKEDADIVFMPYNYILDPRIRKSQGINLENNVILLDEAHNVEKTCEEAASLQITSTDVAVCIDEITYVMNELLQIKEKEERDSTTEDTNTVQMIDFTLPDLYNLKKMFLKLEEIIDAIEIKNRNDGETMPGGYIFELLENVQLTHENSQIVGEKLDKIILYLTTKSTTLFLKKGGALQKFSDLLKIVFIGGPQNRQKVKDCYKVYIQFEEQKKNFGKQDGWEVKKNSTNCDGKVISYWCFSPGFGMQQLVDQKIQSVILTSGTLSPLQPFISEIGIKISVTLENPHIVNENQICVGVLSKGPDGHVLNSSFNTRNDPLYIASLGRTIFNFSNLVPYGLLIFFPSYPILNKCREVWQQSGLWTKIASKKPIFVEPQSKHNLPNIMKEFYEKIEDSEFKGAIFMAVCRGKVSEGLDFANNNGRAVMITGLPFPPLKDPRVILKKRYLDDNYAKQKNGLTGQYWYQLEAMRAVNQAIGRIIRHKDDYGAIILCDCRFENSSNKNQLSTWIRPHIKQFTDFGVVTKELRNFFVFLKKLHPESVNITNITKNSITASKTVNSSDLKEIKKSRQSISQSYDTDQFSMKMYLNNSPSKCIPPKEEPLKRTNLIDSLKSTKSKPLFNFNTIKPEEKKSREPEKSANEIIHPRKKVKLITVPFNDDNSIPSTSKVNESETKVESNDTLKSVNVRKGSNYINEVKKHLTEQKFNIFRKMTTEYAKTSNYDNFIQTFEELFGKQPNVTHFYVNFKAFIKKEHKVKFDDYISQMLNQD